MANEWTREMQNVLEALNKGDGSLLVQFLLHQTDLHPDLRLRVEYLLQMGSFNWSPEFPKIGRPKGGREIFFCINLYIRKQELMSAIPKPRVIDIEYQLAEDCASNVEDIKKYVTRGKKALQDFAEKPDGDWAVEWLNPSAKK